MIFDTNNPWVIPITCAVIGSIFGVVITFLFAYRKEKIAEDMPITSLNNADKLLNKNMNEDALTIYNNLLKDVSEKKIQKFMLISKTVKEFVTVI